MEIANSRYAFYHVKNLEI